MWKKWCDEWRGHYVEGVLLFLLTLLAVGMAAWAAGVIAFGWGA